jgi:hypothetical protein
MKNTLIPTDMPDYCPPPEPDTLAEYVKYLVARYQADGRATMEPSTIETMTREIGLWLERHVHTLPCGCRLRRVQIEDSKSPYMPVLSVKEGISTHGLNCAQYGRVYADLYPLLPLEDGAKV